jgi:prevent-host-death family protein
MQVTVREAKNQLSQLVEFASAGGEVVIAKRGRPVAKLVSVHVAAEAASAGQARNFIQWLGQNPLPASAQRTAQEIDEAIARERSAWTDTELSP